MTGRLSCFAEPGQAEGKPVWAVSKSQYAGWLEQQPETSRNWLAAGRFEPKPQRTALLPDAAGGVAGAVLIASDPAELWDYAALRQALPAGVWRLAAADGRLDQARAGLGWALASYQFQRYRKPADEPPVQLAIEPAPMRRAEIVASAIYLARDLINTGAGDLGPAELAAACGAVADRFDASFRTIEGEALLAQNYPAIHAVGRASSQAPRLVELVWGDQAAPKVTLIGKGVCFDTGGLDIKPSAAMLLMKKDMGGAAVTLGLAQAIMALRLPVRLRLLIGAVENSIAGSAFRPGDVLATRRGLTVEIGNTDAEGRLVLADLLTEADREQPALMLDCATLTGAARVALGPDLPALLTPDDALAADLLAAGQAAEDPLWRLPLHAPYREMLDSPIADINNAGSGGMAGAITAGLFLKDFVTETAAWAHLDLYAWNPSGRPGRPKGGEATALRALLALVERRFGG